MIREIQIPDAPRSVQTVTLDGVTVQLAIYTDKANGRWCLDIGGLVQGLALVTGLDLLFPYSHLDGLPPGLLFVAWHDGPPQDPGLDDFKDKRASLYYLEAAS